MLQPVSALNASVNKALVEDGARTNLLDTIHESRLNLWFADFPTADWPDGSILTFTFFWKRDQRWEGRDWQVKTL
jgi:hypothetical protein